jgi:2-amino-4-hydroxy-6-hydroxymethyldihydropteridine diphosphokinase
LGLGSNRGESRVILQSAVARLSSILTDMRVSSLYITSPRDFADQPDFFNLVVTGFFRGTCHELLDLIHSIEDDFGRDRKNEIPKGPRTLDIDIELFGQTVVRGTALTVPHEQLRFRQFVLVPLVELEPDCADPVTGETYRELCGQLPDQGVRKAGSLHGN